MLMEDNRERQRPRIPYSRVKKSILKCELHGKDSEECKRELRELGINEDE